jgi:hypothetical protein
VNVPRATWVTVGAAAILSLPAQAEQVWTSSLVKWIYPQGDGQTVVKVAGI